MLTRDSILSASDIETRDVGVPEWGGSVRLRSLTGLERDSWEASNRLLKGSEYVPNIKGAKARLLVRAMVDENGVRLFADTDAGALAAKSAGVIERLAEVVAQMSGITETAVEDAAGNSDGAPSASSPSDSPNDSATPSPNFSSESAPLS